MAKSKNHTAHNQTAKHHKNGFKKPREERHQTSRMVNQQLRRNIRRARLFDPNVKKSVNLAKRIAQRRTDKKKIQDAIREAIIKKAIAVPVVVKKAAAPEPSKKAQKAAEKK